MYSFPVSPFGASALTCTPFPSCSTKMASAAGINIPASSFGSSPLYIMPFSTQSAIDHQPPVRPCLTGTSSFSSLSCVVEDGLSYAEVLKNSIQSREFCCPRKPSLPACFAHPYLPFTSARPRSSFTSARPLSSVSSSHPPYFTFARPRSFPFPYTNPVARFSCRTNPVGPSSFCTNPFAPSSSFSFARPRSSFTSTRPHSSFSFSRPRSSFTSTRPHSSFTSVRPRSSFTFSRPPSFTSTRPSFTFARPRSFPFPYTNPVTSSFHANSVARSSSYTNPVARFSCRTNPVGPSSFCTNSFAPSSSFSFARPRSSFTSARPPSSFPFARPRCSYTSAPSRSSFPSAHPRSFFFPYTNSVAPSSSRTNSVAPSSSRTNSVAPSSSHTNTFAISSSHTNSSITSRSMRPVFAGVERGQLGISEKAAMCDFVRKLKIQGSKARGGLGNRYEYLFANRSYRYGKNLSRLVEPCGAFSEVEHLCEGVVRDLGLVKPNACLLVYYPKGTTGLTIHKDTEPAHACDQVITLCHGVGATLVIADNNQQEVAREWLKGGDFYIFRDQSLFYHGVDGKSTDGGRWAFTFRVFRPSKSVRSIRKPRPLVSNSVANANTLPVSAAGENARGVSVSNAACDIIVPTITAACNNAACDSFSSLIRPHSNASEFPNRFHTNFSSVYSFTDVPFSGPSESSESLSAIDIL